jgi:RNA-directed DNA polymerase
MTKEERLKRRRQFISKYDDFDKIFTFENLYKAYRKCIENVSWKPSVQKFIAEDLVLIINLEKKLKNGTFKSKGFYEFDIIERGKPRHIRSVDIEERVVQRCLCDFCLVPVLSRSLIYDNGASLKGKGQHFAIRRIKRHLREYFNKYGVSGVVLTMDFKGYFDSIKHWLVYEVIDNTFTDERLLNLIHHFVDAFGDVGLGLGSQISQILAITVANGLDHYVKEVLGVKWYGRYNDDMWFICRTKEEAAMVAEKVIEFTKTLDLMIHPRKIKISPLTKGFKLMKIKFILKPSGYVLMLPDKKKVVSERRKLKKLKKKVDDGVLTDKDGFLSWQGWDCGMKICNSYKQRKEIKELAINLFGKEYFNVLQVNRKWKNRRYSKEPILCEMAAEE